MTRNKAVAIAVAIVAVLGLTIFSPLKNPFIEGVTKNEVASSREKISLEKTVIKDLVVGAGKEVFANMTVTLHYVGSLENGRVFDSSRQANNPFVFEVGRGLVIQGFDQGIIGMRVGGKRKLIIPPEEGYGDRVVGPIPANSTLTFEVEILDVK